MPTIHSDPARGSDLHWPIEEPALTDPTPTDDPEVDLPGGGPSAQSSYEYGECPAQPADPARRKRIDAWLDQAIIEEVRFCRSRSVGASGLGSWRRYRELATDVDPHDLRRCGWGLVLPETMDAAIEEALTELIVHRQDQMAGREARIYRYPSGMSPRQFVDDVLCVPPGVLDTGESPYYLLLVGDPEQIPFDLQFQLNIQHAVGRVSFDSADDYSRWARRMMAAEDRGPILPSRCSFFSVRHEGDAATDRLAEQLVDPLYSALDGRVAAWGMERWDADRAYRKDLLRLLGGDATPAVLIVACHGLAVGPQPPLQRQLQGALVCQDRPTGMPASAEHCVTAADIHTHGRMDGMIVLMLACHGAGTPELDSYPRRDWRPGDIAETTILAPLPFVASLPQALLANGASAVLGHVDRGWTLSFSWMMDGELHEAANHFEDVLLRLLMGHRLGHALRPLYRRYTALAARYAPLVDRLLDGRELNDTEVAELRLLRLATEDARRFVLLGDPAIYARGKRTSRRFRS